MQERRGLTKYIINDNMKTTAGGCYCLNATTKSGDFIVILGTFVKCDDTGHKCDSGITCAMVTCRQNAMSAIQFKKPLSIAVSQYSYRKSAAVKGGQESKHSKRQMFRGHL